MHMGGDEVDRTCFDENPHIKEFMESKKLKTYDDLINWHKY